MNEIENNVKTNREGSGEDERGDKKDDNAQVEVGAL